MSNDFGHLDPDRTFIYREHSVIYGFETDTYCFTCLVKRGFLTGLRARMPDEFAWAIGQSINTLKDFVTKLQPLRLKKEL